MELKIREAASAAGVSVRTLHHYDQIGLLKPAKVLENGYRLYSDDDMQRLQQIMFFRELDFSLSDILEIIGNPQYDRTGALQAQLELLLKKRKRLDSIIASLKKTIKTEVGGKTMTNKERFGAFDMTEIEEHKKKYAAETEEMFGGSSAFEESKMKTDSYNKNDWERITAAGNAIFTEIAALLDRDPGDAEVQAGVEKWRRHINANFYSCSVEILGGLGEMYSADERFRKNIDKTKDGLAAFLSAAIKVYCEKH